MITREVNEGNYIIFYKDNIKELLARHNSYNNHKRMPRRRSRKGE
jgi:hypothetical protein